MKLFSGCYYNNSWTPWPICLKFQHNTHPEQVKWTDSLLVGYANGSFQSDSGGSDEMANIGTGHRDLQTLCQNPKRLSHNLQDVFMHELQTHSGLFATITRLRSFILVFLTFCSHSTRLRFWFIWWSVNAWFSVFECVCASVWMLEITEFLLMMLFLSKAIT